MLKKLALLALLNNSFALHAEKKHIIINDRYEKDLGKGILKTVLPLIAGFSFISCAFHTKTALLPAALLRGTNACVLGVLNKPDMLHYYNHPQLISTEAGIIGTALVASSLVKTLVALNTHIIQPSVDVVKKTYTATKETVSFVYDHALLCGVVAAGSIGTYYYLVPDAMPAFMRKLQLFNK